MGSALRSRRSQSAEHGRSCMLLVLGISVAVVVGALFGGLAWWHYRRLRQSERLLERRTLELTQSRAAENRLIEELRESQHAEEDAQRAKANADSANRAKGR